MVRGSAVKGMHGPETKRVSIALRVSSRKPLAYKSWPNTRITARKSRSTVGALSRPVPNKEGGELSDAKGVSAIYINFPSEYA